MAKQSDLNIPRIGAAQIKLLERLSNACAVSGDEGEVRKILLEQVKPHADEVKVDALGNVLAIRRGTVEPVGGGARPRVMLAAHMDEVGFMLTKDEGEGIFRFGIVGSIDVRQLAGKPVWVGREHLPGVIGVKPIHLVERDERKRATPLEALRIDLGPAGSKAKIGDRAAFGTSFARLGPSLMGKALDDRLGVATLIELVRHAPPGIDLLGAFTTQEEIGGRGAQAAAFTFNPDMAIALDTTPANDLPLFDGSENSSYNTRLDHGPAIYVHDAGTLSDPRLIRHLVNIAEKYKIPYQIRQPGGGSTDAGAIHRQRGGIPSVSVSVPGRYTHTAVAIARLADWQNTLALVYTALASLTLDILAVSR